jgi:hypothetical protein
MFRLCFRFVPVYFGGIPAVGPGEIRQGILKMKQNKKPRFTAGLISSKNHCVYYKWLIASLSITTPSVVLAPVSNISAELRS